MVEIHHPDTFPELLWKITKHELRRSNYIKNGGVLSALDIWIH